MRNSNNKVYGEKGQSRIIWAGKNKAHKYESIYLPIFCFWLWSLKKLCFKNTLIKTEKMHIGQKFYNSMLAVQKRAKKESFSQTKNFQTVPLGIMETALAKLLGSRIWQALWRAAGPLPGELWRGLPTLSGQFNAIVPLFHWKKLEISAYDISTLCVISSYFWIEVTGWVSFGNSVLGDG